MRPSIRPATSADLKPILAFDPRADTRERRELIASAIEHGECHVAGQAAEVIGYAILNYRFYGRAFLELLVVDPRFRRQQIGTSLVEHIHSLCPTPKIFTSCNESNRPMQAFLDKLGYVRSGIIHNLDEGDPEIVYVKHLTRP